MAIADDFKFDPVTQRIYHDPNGAEPTRVWSLNSLYTHLTLSFDDDVQMDDLPPMSAQTPTAFTMENGWFIDPVSLRFLNSGSLNTIGWSASIYDNGIRLLTFGATYTDAVDTDTGKPVTSTGGDTGTLLYFDNTLHKWWVRCNSTADTFDAAETISVTDGAGTGTTTGASATGESTWANIFTLGTLATNSQIYIYQNGAQITPWWPTGHIDVLIKVKEASTLIDAGNVVILARQYSKLYDHYVADLSSGARTPIPVATFNDAANGTGYRTFTGSAGSGTFLAKEIIGKTGDPTVQGIVTRVDGTSEAPVLTYYLFKYPLTDFTDSDSVTGLASNATCSAGTPGAAGPASLAGITITFGATSKNLGNNAGNRPYDVIVDCNMTPLSSVYEYLKYLTRYGSSTAINGRPGEYYTGVGDIRLSYSGQTVNFSEGETVNGENSGATGIIVADHDDGATGALILRDVRGSFEAGEKIRVGETDSADAGTAVVIIPSKQSPFGTYAGGKFFGAQGVWLDHVPSYDANNFELIDSEGVSQVPPTTVSIVVNNTENGDQVSIFRTTGDNEIIDKNMFTSHATNNTQNAATFTVQELIPADTPASGSIRVVKRTADGTISGEDRYTYQSWFGNTFNLAAGQQLVQGYDSTDTAYTPYLDVTADSTSVTKTISFVGNRYVLARVRKKGIIPFNNKGQITSMGLTVSTIRTPDTIVT